MGCGLYYFPMELLMTCNVYSKKNELIAQIYNINSMNNTEFPTPDNLSFQFGVGVAKEDKALKTHIHKRAERVINTTSEFLYVINGMMKVGIYDEEENFIQNVELTDNESLLQFVGGHSIYLEKGTKYFEIKQGPYFGREFDKYDLEVENE